MKYKVGDRVRVKSLDWYNEQKNPIGVVWVPEGIAFGKDRAYFCGKIVEIKAAYADRYTIHGSPWSWTDEMFEGLAEAEEGLYKTKSRIPTISELCDFVSLVKQLREAEKEEACLPSHAYDDELSRKREDLQREIDKRIKELGI